MHQIDSAQQAALVAHESEFVFDSASRQQLSALLECVEEDLLVDGVGEGHRSPHHATEETFPTQQDEDDAASSSDPSADSNADIEEAFAIQPPKDVFTVKVIKPRGVTLGFSLQKEASALLVERVLPDGVVALWNAQRKGEHQVANCNKIVSVKCSTDSQQMLAYFSQSGSLSFDLLKGPFEEETSCLL